jgi:hypothetical protein
VAHPDHDELRRLEAELLVRAAQVHAAHAALAETLARFDALRGWEGAGIRSVGHWADINLGIPSRAASRMAAAAARLDELPTLRQAFVEGAVSVEKVEAVAAVAAARSDDRFTQVARSGSVAQVQRICSTYRNVMVEDAPPAVEERQVRRAVTCTPIDDGLLRLVAILEPDEATLVLTAIDARVEHVWRQHHPDRDTPAADLSVRRADALVELARDAADIGPDPFLAGERVQVNVHVDAEVLGGVREDGICCIDGVGAIAPAVARRLLCDASVRVITHHPDGSLDLGRTQQTVSQRQRRVLNERDGGCRFPGCPHRRYVDAHHAVPWDDGGPTDLDNLLLLCKQHHRLFHDGSYRMTVHGKGEFSFYRPDGRQIATPPLHAPPPGGSPPTGNPRAGDGGGRYDLDLTITALAS